MCTCQALSEQKCACVEKWSHSDSESDCAVLTTSGLETGSGQTSNAESTIPESGLDASASTASSLSSLSTIFGLGAKETS